MASILVVDADADGRERCREALELDGFRVTTAADGTEALSAVGSDPDVIVCHTDLPELDGWELLARLKADDDPEVSGIPVLLVCPLPSASDEIRAGIEGALDLLVQPLSADELRTAVMAALSGGPELEQRRRSQVAALEQLARAESGHDPDAGFRVHLTRLESFDRERPTPPGRGAGDLPLEALTDKQIDLLETLRTSPSVSAAATSLGVSRSNVYASLRRISRKLDVDSVPTLLHLLRTDQLST